MPTRHSKISSGECFGSRRVQRSSSPSPRMDDPNAARYCLPSISSLIEAADEGTGRERLQIDPRLQKVVVDPQLLPQGQERPLIVSNPTNLLPPNLPQLQSGSSFDNHRQPPTADSSHATTFIMSGSDKRAPVSAINDVEANAQRHMNYPPIAHDRPLRPLQGPVSPYAATSYGSAGDASTASYQGSPVEDTTAGVLPYQRPLPSALSPPSSYDEPSGQYISHATPAWQHHHHFPHSASTPYPPNQDRYICSTCNKAFSRPSSLKIHTYSHTGEKPWKCQISGCGKTFSVRSNMKRHEKGCHGDGGFPDSGLGRASPEIAS